MNDAVASRKRPARKRSYDNTLREEQAQLTRRRILDAAVAVLCEAPPHGVTLSAVAKRAGVSEPTLYRHFGSREKLLEELDRHAQQQMGLPGAPPTARDLPAHAKHLAKMFEENHDVLLAATQAGIGHEMRASGKARRAKHVHALIAAHAKHLDAASIDRAAAVIRILGGWETFRAMTAELGLSASDAGEAVSWAIEALLDRLEDEGGKR